jgi:uncharacterized protein YggU (UPF0235/DUF167 family)
MEKIIMAVATICDIKVIPSSGKQGFKRDKSGMIVCNLKSAPERGAANAELIRLVAAACKVTQAEVTIIGGLTSRKKRLKIAKEISKAELLALLGIHDQLSLF